MGWESGRGLKRGIRWTDRQHKEADGGGEGRERKGERIHQKVAADRRDHSGGEDGRGPLFSL